MRRLDGDILILGASGKMGPSLARLCRRAADAAGRRRRVIGVSRHPEPDAGVETIACDLLQRPQIEQLPACPNILYLAGRKFGSSGSPELTWAINSVVPAFVAEKFYRFASSCSQREMSTRFVPSRAEVHSRPTGRNR
jgi:nucleoside-diphosphate-sugar epimerase